MPSLSCPVKRKQLTVQSVNRNLVKGDSVEELIAQKISQIKEELAAQGPGVGKQRSFKEVLDASEETASCEQASFTFLRQVSALCCMPELVEVLPLPQDVTARARLLLGNHAVDSCGLEVVREHVAGYLEQRDGCPADYRDVIIVDGLTTALKVVSKVLNALCGGALAGAGAAVAVGVLCPLPQFLPLSQQLDGHGLRKMYYYLDEERGWAIDEEELGKSLSEGKTFCEPGAILVVNPGYPTGSILTKKNIEEIIKFSEKEKLMIISLEMYQEVHNDNVFYSFKKVVSEMSSPYSGVQLLSLMLYSGELCRGPGQGSGYVEMCNLDPRVRSLVTDSIAPWDAAPLLSQVAVDCLVNPPRPGDASYAVFRRDTLTSRVYTGVTSHTASSCFNKTRGISCTPVQAGYCVFVKVEIPKKAVDRAKDLRLCPSTFYVLEMLEDCGVSVVPGERYGQRPGSFHFMMSTMMPEDKLKKVLKRIQEFHLKFLDLYK